MAMIQVTPELLMGKAGEVRGYRSEHDAIIQKLNTLMHALNETWKGESQDALVAKFDSMQAQFKQFSELLEGYAKLMDTAAKELQATDQSLKGTVQSFG